MALTLDFTLPLGGSRGTSGEGWEFDSPPKC